MVQMGPHGIDRDRFDWDQIEQNPFWTPDAKAATDWADYLDALRKSGDSVGAIIEVTRAAASRRPRRTDLRQARHRPRRRHDVDQRGQGRRDRRWHGRRRAHRQCKRR
jgi:hypothetical protein